MAKNEFWGINFQKYSKKETFEIIDKCLDENSSNLFISTINPELLLLTEKDLDYKDVLNNSDLKSIDGIGVKIIGWFKNREVSARISGADLAGYVLKEAIKRNLKIAFVFRKDGLSSLEDVEKLCEKLQTTDVKCIAYDLKNDNNDFDFQDREVVLVGLGAPYQEKFIFENKKNWPNLKLAIGVGGTFDFWTGKQKRAPRLMRKIGFEWLWRLITRPKRFWKIWRSTGIFVMKSLIK